MEHYPPAPGRISLRRPERTPAVRRERALALAADLVDDLDKVDLDEIDGEFYWRCCRTDLLDRLADVCARRPRPIGAKKERDGRVPESDDDLGGLVEPTEPIAYLRAGLRYANELLDLADEAASLFPGTVWPRLLDGERIAMRGAAARLGGSDPRGGREPSVHLKVYSGAWTGAEVEDELRRQAMDGARWLPQLVGRDNHGLVMRLGFALAGDQSGAGVDPAADPPHVAVEAELPLPPDGAVAREYDALVRRERQWHLVLPGGGSRQDKEVAIRTWAVGLLVAEGQRFGAAMAAVHEAAGVPDVSQARHGQDRTRLVARVPEAQPYIYARGAGGPSLLSCNPDPADPLANPPHPAPPLQGEPPDEGAYT